MQIEEALLRVSERAGKTIRFGIQGFDGDAELLDGGGDPLGMPFRGGSQLRGDGSQVNCIQSLLDRPPPRRDTTSGLVEGRKTEPDDLLQGVGDRLLRTSLGKAVDRVRECGKRLLGVESVEDATKDPSLETAFTIVVDQLGSRTESEFLRTDGGQSRHEAVDRADLQFRKVPQEASKDALEVLWLEQVEVQVGRQLIACLILEQALRHAHEDPLADLRGGGTGERGRQQSAWIRSPKNQVEIPGGEPMGLAGTSRCQDAGVRGGESFVDLLVGVVQPEFKGA